MSRAVRLWTAGFGLLLGLLLLLWHRADTRPLSDEGSRVFADVLPVPSPDAGTTIDTDAGAPSRPAPPSPSSTTCEPRTERRCFTGDVWWFDSCGEPEEQAEECGLARCVDNACERPDPLGCDEPITGRCDGDRVRSCFGGRERVIDCEAKGLHCVMGAEGAECRSEAPDEEPAACVGEEARCDGDVLVQCLGAREARVECTRWGARCMSDIPGAEAACVVLGQGTAPPDDPQCGPCGCPPDDSQEACNGEDDNGDGLIDEGADCGPVDVIAFVVGRPGVYGSYEPFDIEQEIQRINTALAASGSFGSGLRVRLLETVWLDRPDLLEIPEEMLSELAHAPLVHPEREEFYVPILFTDEVQVGEVPKPGTSTLPNGTCGGHQTGRGPRVGLIAVSKPRSPTTVVHEIGHFLGLCHTHEDDQARPQRLLTDRGGELFACDDACQYEGDGVCDTPVDPGAKRCPFNSQCQVFCPGPESPDPSNLMSYYTACRYRFTPEQLRLMQHTLALRRGWHECLDGSCACTPGLEDCPVGMGCRPLRDEETESVVHRCALEGPVDPGQACDGLFECRGDALCVDVSGAPTCARTCVGSTRGCTCESGGGELRVCREDL